MPAPRPRFQVVTALAAFAAAAGACGEPAPAGGNAPGGAGGNAPAPALTPAAAAKLVAHENRGIALLERYDYGAAVKELRAAAAIAPGWIPGRVHLALGLIHAGPASRPEARQILEGVLKEDPAHPHAAFLAAWLAENNGETELAIRLYRDAWKLTGEDPICGARLGTILAGTEDRQKEALELLTTVHERRPALISPVNQLMLLHRQTGNDAEAEKYLAKLLALKGRLRADVDSGKVGEEMRDAYGNMGRFSAAMRDFGDPGAAAAPAAGGIAATSAELAGWKPGDLPSGAPYLGAAVLDFDGDGDLDVFVCGGTGPAALLRNDGGGACTDVAAKAGVAVTGTYAAAAGEIDVDPSKTSNAPPGRRAHVDLVVLRADGVTVLRSKGDGTFADATKESGLAADPGGARAAFLWDADHDGDLDLFLSGAEGRSNRLWANRGPGVFTDATADSGLAGDGGAYGPAVAVDFDEDYDMDLVVSRPGAPPAVFANDRLLRFHSVPAPSGAGAAPHGALAGDLDRDGHEDVVLLAEAGATLLAGHGKGFAARSVAGAPGGAATTLDPRLRGETGLLFAEGTWLPVAGAAPAAGQRLFDGKGLANVVAADFDGDGSEEVLRILPGAPLRRVVVSADGRGNAVTIDLEGVIRNDVQAGWSNLEGRGALVEVKAGALWQQRRTGNASGFGCAAPARIVAGVGAAPQADFVRVLWPDAVQQAVLDLPSGPPQVIVEEQRRPDSCPILFSWDGERWAFVTDFLGVGGVGFLIAPGVYGAPDPTESVKVDASAVRPRDGGRLVFKLLESMEEVCYIDHCDLLAVDHPSGVTVYPDERFQGEAPFPDGRLLAYRDEILPVAARDGAGKDVLERIATVDRRYPDSFRLHPRLYGSTDEAVLELDFGDRLAGVAPGDPVAFLANGWIEYGYTRTTVAAAGEGFEMKVPALEAWDAAAEGGKGAWRTLVANMGYPAGFPRVMTYDLKGLVSRETPRLRIRTNFEIYWDRIWLARTLDAARETRATALAAEEADLRWVGYPREYSPDGRIPRIYDYGTMDPTMPWKTVAGDYTKFGDVTPLLARGDDMYVIFGKGEEIEVRFDPKGLPALPEGWTRSWVLRFTGWCKGQEMYTAHGWTVEPLPFLGMSHYPYRADERYPDDEAHREYRRVWNTRRVNAPASR